MTAHKHTASPQPHRKQQSGPLQDEVYRQMFRLESGHPRAAISLALALLRAWQAAESESAAGEQRLWLRKICPICIAMIEAAQGAAGDSPLCT